MIHTSIGRAAVAEEYRIKATAAVKEASFIVDHPEIDCTQEIICLEQCETRGVLLKSWLYATAPCISLCATSYHSPLQQNAVPHLALRIRPSSTPFVTSVVGNSYTPGDPRFSYEAEISFASSALCMPCDQ